MKRGQGQASVLGCSAQARFRQRAPKDPGLIGPAPLACPLHPEQAVGAAVLQQLAGQRAAIQRSRDSAASVGRAVAEADAATRRLAKPWWQPWG